ncbi:MAG TPA: c-type cytochrome [Kofleriaceae bacterium]
MRWLLLVMVTARVAAAQPATKPGEHPHGLPGWRTYDRYCLACHGSDGDGRGPASPFTSGRPRDFTSGNYEWRSTPIGQPPTDADLQTTIANGAPGTSMPAFGGVLSAREMADVIDVVKAFSRATFAGRPPVPIVLGRERAPAADRGKYLWTQLGCERCHGDGGRGDGPSAKGLTEPPYDLVTEPLRRPRALDDLEDRRLAAARSIATGMAGTAMPGYLGPSSVADVWALADRVVELGANARRGERSTIDADEIAADRAKPVATATWPGHDAREARVFGAAIPEQGAPPPSLAPAEASLASAQCGRCHAKQVREWQPSVHAGTVSPGVRAQTDFGMAPERAAACLRCHAPLAEQRRDLALRAEGATCAGCHLRGWTRLGPPNVSPALLALPSYPREELAIYERGDFCMPCHQLMPRDAVAGKPLLNTYKEWLEGPYMRRGVQCQHCHMPNREHTWLGVHDPATFRQGIQLDARAHRADGAVTVVAELRNIGAGHDLPTTATPAAFLRVELYDARGRAIEGARAELRIGRDVYYDGAWHERADTRIPPGEAIALVRAWRDGRTGDAAFARVTVEVHPDAYYEGFYAQQLAGKTAPGARALFEQAAARAARSHYIAEQRDLPIESVGPAGARSSAEGVAQHDR